MRYLILCFLSLFVSLSVFGQCTTIEKEDIIRIGRRYIPNHIHILLGIAEEETQFGCIQGKTSVLASYIRLRDNSIEDRDRRYWQTQIHDLYKIAEHTGRNVSEFTGSRSGAMGYMQFLACTWRLYAQDGNNDGIKDPLCPEDSIATAAFYMARQLAKKEYNIGAALRTYNNSSRYVRVVKELAAQHKLELAQLKK